jgi:hypothetical protein
LTGSRLRVIDGAMAARVAGLTETSKRRVATAVCDLAIAKTGLAGPQVDKALDALRDERWGESDERAELKALLDALDARAWDAQEGIDRGDATMEEYADLFCQARAAATVWFALDEDPTIAVSESVYEAQAALGGLEPLGAKIDELESVEP